MPNQQAVEKTQEYWQGRLGREIHPCEAYRAARNMAALADLLMEWDEEDRGDGDGADTVDAAEDSQEELAPSFPV